MLNKKKIIVLINRVIKSILTAMPTRDTILNKFISQDDRRRRTTVLSPILWIAGIVVTGGFWYMETTGDTIGKIFAGVLIFVIIGYFIFNYEWYKQHDPDRLHSEEYLIAKRGIELMATQGEGVRQIDEGDLVEIKKLVGSGAKGQ